MKVNLTIDRLEGDKIILIDTNGNTIVWPRTKMPEEYREGTSLVFDISADGEKKVSEEAAKDILNEILDIN